MFSMLGMCIFKLWHTDVGCFILMNTVLSSGFVHAWWSLGFANSAIVDPPIVCYQTPFLHLQLIKVLYSICGVLSQEANPDMADHHVR